MTTIPNTYSTLQIILDIKKIFNLLQFTVIPVFRFCFLWSSKRFIKRSTALLDGAHRQILTLGLPCSIKSPQYHNKMKNYRRMPYNIPKGFSPSKKRREKENESNSLWVCFIYCASVTCISNLFHWAKCISIYMHLVFNSYSLTKSAPHLPLHDRSHWKHYL